MTTQDLVERLLQIVDPHAPAIDALTEDRIIRAAASRLSEMEQERRDISMALGNQPDEQVSTAELIENIERISRIAGKGVIRLSELEGENKRLREAMRSALKRLEKGAPGWGVAKDELRDALNPHHDKEPQQ